MNPWGLLAIVVASVAITGGVYMQGRKDGANSELAAQAREDKAAARATQAAASAVAVAISKIEVKNVTIRQPLETIVRTEPVFRDCRSGVAAVQLLNATPGIAAAASAFGGGQLPASGPAR